MPWIARELISETQRASRTGSRRLKNLLAADLIDTPIALDDEADLPVGSNRGCSGMLERMR
jgi:hypothetical protein